MKRSLILGLCLILLVSFFSPPVMAETAIDITNAAGHWVDPYYQPKGGSIIASAATGQILWSEDATTRWAPASLTKLMVLYLTYEAIDRGEIQESTVVTVPADITELSTYYALSNNYLPTGSEFTISELIDLLIMPSSAGATMFLIRSLGYEHSDMVKLMNQTASELGMTGTHYDNAIGATNGLLGPFMPPNVAYEGDNHTTATDYAILAAHLVQKHPSVLNHTKLSSFVLKPGTELQQSFTTYNYSLEGASHPFVGMDGLKTGSSDTAAYNFTTTAQRGDTRFVEVVLGVGAWDIKESEVMRSLIGNALLEKAFSEYEYKLALPKGEHTIGTQTVDVKQDLYDIVPIGQEVTFRLVNDQVQLDLDRSYLPGYQAPSVPVELLAGEPIVTEDEPEVTNPQTPPAPVDTTKEARLKKGLLTVGLYLGGIMLLLFGIRFWLLRKVRRRARNRRAGR